MAAFLGCHGQRLGPSRASKSSGAAEGLILHASIHRLVIAGGSDVPMAPTVEDVMDALGTVVDPELGMSIVELGLVYGVEVQDGAVRVTMTLTTPGCPIHRAMSDWVRAAVTKVPGVEAVDVRLTFDPPWTSDRIRRAARHPRGREGTPVDHGVREARGGPAKS